MIQFTICEFLKDYKTYEAIILPMQNKERILLGLQKMNSEEAMDYFLDFDAFRVFSSTLNTTIRSINSRGSGSSNGNCTEPFPCLYFESSLEKAECPEGVA